MDLAGIWHRLVGGETPPAAAVERPAGDSWRRLEPIRPVSRPPQLVGQRRLHASDLPSVPPLRTALQPLGHARSLEVPPGLAEGLARPAVLEPGEPLPASVGSAEPSRAVAAGHATRWSSAVGSTAEPVATAEPSVGPEDRPGPPVGDGPAALTVASAGSVRELERPVGFIGHPRTPAPVAAASAGSAAGAPADPEVIPVAGAATSADTRADASVPSPDPAAAAAAPTTRGRAGQASVRAATAGAATVQENRSVTEPASAAKRAAPGASGAQPGPTVRPRRIRIGLPLGTSLESVAATAASPEPVARATGGAVQRRADLPEVPSLRWTDPGRTIAPPELEVVRGRLLTVGPGVIRPLVGGLTPTIDGPAGGAPDAEGGAPDEATEQSRPLEVIGMRFDLPGVEGSADPATAAVRPGVAGWSTGAGSRPAALIATSTSQTTRPSTAGTGPFAGGPGPTTGGASSQRSASPGPDPIRPLAAAGLRRSPAGPGPRPVPSTTPLAPRSRASSVRVGPALTDRHGTASVPPVSAGSAPGTGSPSEVTAITGQRRIDGPIGSVEGHGAAAVADRTTPVEPPETPVQRRDGADAGTTLSAGSDAGQPGSDSELDALAGRLYERMRLRLRSELLVDRERAGVLIDTGR